MSRVVLQGVHQPGDGKKLLARFVYVIQNFIAARK